MSHVQIIPHNEILPSSNGLLNSYAFQLVNTLFCFSTFQRTYCSDKSGENEAVLEWDHLPIDAQNGFIRNYTIFYRTIGNEIGNKAISVKNQVFFLRLLNTNLSLVFFTS